MPDPKPLATKPCSSCSKTAGKIVLYPLSLEHFYKNSNTPTGFSSQCRACRSKASLKCHTLKSGPADLPKAVRILDDSIPQDGTPLPMGLRRCSNLLCGRVRPFNETYFTKDAYSPLGYSATCKRCQTVKRKMGKSGGSKSSYEELQAAAEFYANEDNGPINPLVY